MSEREPSCYDCKFWQEWTPKVRNDGISCRGQCNNLAVTIGAPIPRHGGIACKYIELIPPSPIKEE